MSCSPFSGWNAGWRQSGAAAAFGAGPPLASRGPRRGLEIVGIVFLFFYFWPVAAAYIAWKVMGYPVPAELKATFDRAADGIRGFGGATTPFAGTGNLAFDEYRRGEIERLERERRKLDEEAQGFRAFVDDLKRAKDRSEFDAYMAQRRNGAGQTSV